MRQKTKSFWILARLSVQMSNKVSIFCEDKAGVDLKAVPKVFSDGAFIRYICYTMKYVKTEESQTVTQPGLDSKRVKIKPGGDS